MHWRVLFAYYVNKYLLHSLLNYNKGFIEETSAWTKNTNKALILTIIKILFFYRVLAIKYRKRAYSVQKWKKYIFDLGLYIFLIFARKGKKLKTYEDVLEWNISKQCKKKKVDLVVIL